MIVFKMHKKLTILILTLGISVALAEDVTLTDKLGRSIEVTIHSVDEQKLVALRKPDRKEITVNLADLDDISMKIVNDWLAKAGRIPSKNFEYTMKVENRSGKVNLRFKLPEGNYNTSGGGSDDIKVVFEGGYFTMRVWSGEETTEKIAALLHDTNQNWLKNMSPEKREKEEPLVKLIHIKHGTLEGYSGFAGSEFNGLWRMCDRKKKICIEVAMSSLSRGDLTSASMPAVFDTIELSIK